ncbi:MAG: hypothetical protein IPN90_00215 [Elusimicrobia bacterium]|nr:hypothetical protein [Elusimicrobiota bacterium]
MKIQKKISLGVILTVAGMMGALFLALGSFISSGFARVEKADTEKNVFRVVDAVDASLKGMQNSLNTWSMWDDAYNYVKKPTVAFEDSNMGASAFTGMNIQVLVFANNDGKIIKALGYDKAAGKLSSVPNSLLERLQKGQPLIVHKDLQSVHRGLITLPEGVLMTVAGPVTNSDVTDPYNGTLLFGRWFDGDQKETLSKVTHMTLDFTPTEEDIPGVIIEPKSRDIISGTTVIKNLDGKPALKVRVDLERAVARQGRQTLQGVMIALGLIGVGLFLVLSLMVNRLIVSRVVSLSSQLLAKNMSFDFSMPTVVPGQGDEIAELTESVNGLIAAAQQVLGSISETGK